MLQPIMQQNALAQLAGGADASRVASYVEGLGANEIEFIAKHPGLSRAIREASGAAPAGDKARAPRSENGFAPDSPSMTREMEVEAERALMAFRNIPGG